MQNSTESKPISRLQEQSRPGFEKDMQPLPISNPDTIVTEPGLKLKNKIAVIKGGDSVTGKAVALLFAKEGADVAIIYLNEHQDAEDTKNLLKPHMVENAYYFQQIFLRNLIAKM